MVGVATALMRILFVVVAAAATAALIESKVVQQQQWEGALLLLLKLAALSAAVNLSSVSTGGALIHHFANFRTPALSVSQIPTGLLLNTYIHTFKNCCQLFWLYAPWSLPNRAELRVFYHRCWFEIVCACCAHTRKFLASWKGGEEGSTLPNPYWVLGNGLRAITQ